MGHTQMQSPKACHLTIGYYSIVEHHCHTINYHKSSKLFYPFYFGGGYAHLFYDERHIDPNLRWNFEYKSQSWKKIRNCIFFIWPFLFEIIIYVVSAESPSNQIQLNIYSYCKTSNLKASNFDFEKNILKIMKCILKKVSRPNSGLFFLLRLMAYPLGCPHLHVWNVKHNSNVNYACRYHITSIFHTHVTFV